MSVATQTPSLRIVHIITRFIRGGADENTLLCCNAHARMGHEVHLLYGSEFSDAMVGRLDPSVRHHRIEHLHRSIRPLDDIRATVRTAAVLRRIRPDVVHTHTSKAGVVGRLAARLAGIRGIVHGIHILPFLSVGRWEARLYVAVERLLSRVTHTFVDVSDAMRDMATRHGVGNAANHVVVQSGMELDRFRLATPVSDHEVRAVLPALNTSKPVKLVVMVAALESRKRVKEFVELFAKVAARDDAAGLAVLGDGPCREEILAAVREKGLDGRVVLLGFKADVERWIARANVCALSSEREGLPRVVVQYVLAGKPVVVTDLPGVSGLVPDGVNGIVVPTDQLDPMADALTRILDDSALAAAMSAASAKLDLSAWSADSMVQRLEGVYRSVAGSGSMNSIGNAG